MFILIEDKCQRYTNLCSMNCKRISQLGWWLCSPFFHFCKHISCSFFSPAASLLPLRAWGDLRVHAWLMEGIVPVGAMTFLWQAFN